MTLSLGWPDYEWTQLTEVLLYPDDFDRDYRVGENERAGQAHPWGTVILSVPALFESFEVPDDAYHVGIHEFAHLLDVDQTHFDGIPVGLDGRLAREWVRRSRRGRWSACGAAAPPSTSTGPTTPSSSWRWRWRRFFEIPQVAAPPPPRALRAPPRVLPPGPRGLGRRARPARVSPC